MDKNRVGLEIASTGKNERIEGVHFTSESRGRCTTDAPTPEHPAEESDDNPLLRVLTSLGK
jgi:hypothetical protein